MPMDNPGGRAQRLTEERVKPWEELGAHVCDPPSACREEHQHVLLCCEDTSLPMFQNLAPFASCWLHRAAPGRISVPPKFPHRPDCDKIPLNHAPEIAEETQGDD